MKGWIFRLYRRAGGNHVCRVPSATTDLLEQRVLEMIVAVEPTTLFGLASLLDRPPSAVQSAVQQLEHAGKVHRWLDCSRTGDGRPFIGSVASGVIGPDLPEPDGRVPEFDRRTLLSCLRRVLATTPPKLAKLTGIQDRERLDCALAALERAGHLTFIRTPRSGAIKGIKAVTRPQATMT